MESISAESSDNAGRYLALQVRQTPNSIVLPRNRFRLAGNETGQLEDTKTKFSFAFFWLASFYLVYCGRPSDLIPGFGSIHPAKLTAGLAILSLLFSIRTASRQLKDIPKEGLYLLFLILVSFLSALLSPVWRGGALDTTLDFAKVYFAWVATFLLVTTLKELKRIIFLQSASVAVIAVAAMVKGRDVPRLDSVIGGVYSAPNDLALAIALCIPFCLAFLLTARRLIFKVAWLSAIIAMTVALLLTASRAGFIDLAVSGIVLLWHFGVKGKRGYLIIAAIVLMAGAWVFAGKQLAVRWNGFFNSGASVEQDTAHESYVERRILVDRAIEIVAEYPILGIGSGNFVVRSGMWRDVHMSYLQIAVDSGIPALILYLMFFARGFINLGMLSKASNLDAETVLFVGAIKSALVGFVVGACFAPVAYQFFPYFFVCYTSILAALVRERELGGAVGNVLDSSISRRRSLSRGSLNGLIHTQ